MPPRGQAAGHDAKVAGAFLVASFGVEALLLPHTLYLAGGAGQGEAPWNRPPPFRIRDLVKRYAPAGSGEGKLALGGVSFDVPRGQVFGLLGPNGAGKSTLINTLAGMVMKTSGTIEIWGHDIDRDRRDAKASIGIMPQEVVFDPFFTPIEVLEIQAGLYGVPKAQRRSMELLKAVHLDDKAHAYARSLSGGMRRRLLIAKAMVHRPRTGARRADRRGGRRIAAPVVGTRARVER
jgi:ABC-type glutathione transport system ATPase component